MFEKISLHGYMRVSYDVDFWLRKGSRKIWKLDVQVWRWLGGRGWVRRVIETCIPSEAVKRWTGCLVFES